MKTKVSRTALLQVLEAVEPGLTLRAAVEQSNSIVFSKGFVYTYNEELCCRIKSPLPASFHCAVRGKPLVEVVRKLTDEDLTVFLTDKEFRVSGSRDRGAIRAEQEVLLPYGQVEKPETWSPVPDELKDALSMAAECASKDEASFVLTCVHVTPEHVEACDDLQMLRYKLKLPLQSRFLIRKESAKHVAAVGVDRLAETKHWVHFRNNSGLRISCKRYDEEYPELSEEFARFKGRKFEFPTSTAEKVEFGSIFSSENPDDDQLTVTIGDGKFLIRGDGVSGYGEAFAKFPHDKWQGPALSFGIGPKLLTEIVQKKNRKKCFVSNERLLAKGGTWTYLACLRKVSSNGHAKKESVTTNEGEE